MVTFPARLLCLPQSVDTSQHVVPATPTSMGRESGVCDTTIHLCWWLSSMVAHVEQVASSWDRCSKVCTSRIGLYTHQWNSPSSYHVHSCELRSHHSLVVMFRTSSSYCTSSLVSSIWAVFPPGITELQCLTIHRWIIALWRNGEFCIAIGDVTMTTDISNLVIFYLLASVV